MRPVYVSVTGVGVSPPVPMDARKAPFTAGVAVVVTGTVTYSVQHTYDDITLTTFNPSTANWFNSVLNGATANGEVHYDVPVRAIRLNVTAGTGTAQMQIIQGTGTS